MPVTLVRHRYGVLFTFFVVSLFVFFLIRTALLVKSFALLDASMWSVLKIYAVGSIYDLALYSYFAIPFIVYLMLLPERIYLSRWHRYVAYLVFIGGIYGLLFTGVAEWLFWDEFGVRFNFISVDYLIYRREVTGNIYESYPLFQILFALLVASLALFLPVRRYVDAALQSPSSFRGRSGAGLLLLAVPLLSYLLVGQSLKEVSPNRYQTELAENGMYQFFNAFRANELDYKTFYINKDPAQMSAQLRQEVVSANSRFVNEDAFDLTRRVQSQGELKHLNVMLVVVESLSAEYLGVFGNNKGLSPHLDALSKEGLLFTNFYATGTRTVRGLEAISLSIPPTPGRSIVKRDDNKGMYSLGYVFKEQGYDTRFIYGGHGYFDNMNAFFAANGFDIVDRSDMAADEIHFANIWGVADEDLFARAIKEANSSYQKGKPFMSLIMTTSNHRPYTYPDGAIDIPSGSGRDGAVKYTDYAIGQLLEQSKKQPWFDDTLFVIVADHCAGSAGKTALPVDRYEIPLIMYAPKHLAAAQIDTLSSQIDLAPTILDMLGVDYTSRFFGKSILSMKPSDGRALIGNYQRLGLLKNDSLTILSPQLKAVMVQDPKGKAVVRPLAPADPRLDEAVAFYQGADYIYHRRLDRWLSPAEMATLDASNTPTRRQAAP